jgi:hypothetical protein
LSCRETDRVAVRGRAFSYTLPLVFLLQAYVVDYVLLGV